MGASRGEGASRRARRLWSVAVVPAAIVALVVAGCGSSSDSGGSGGGSGGGNSSKPVTIGASLPLSGDLAQPGKSARQGYEIWQDMVNASGGLLGRKVKLDIVDDASSQKTVVSDYTRLISQDHVDLLLGTFSSLLNFPASAVAEKNRMVYVEPAGGAPQMFTRGFKYLFFAQPAVSTHQADLFSQWVKGLPAGQRPQTAAYISQDDPFAKPVVQAVQQQLSAGGIKTVYGLKLYPPDQTSFDAVVNGIKASNADMVVQGAVFDDAVSTIRQMKQVGYQPKILFQTSAPSEGDQFAKGIGVANTEGIFYAVSWSPKADTPQNKAFVAEYARRFGGTPPEDAADAFGTAQVLQAAVKATKSFDQDKLRDWLHSNSVNTVEGELKWDQTGAPQGQFLVAQWQGGKTEIVLPKNLATSDKIVNPKPPWK
jgi:branched-chain amino acid transport system substrate-binding protein